MILTMSIRRCGFRKNITLAYLALVKDPEVTEFALHVYNIATNITEQFVILTVIAQIPSDVQNENLSNLY